MPITNISEKIRTAYLVSGVVVERDGKFLLVQEKKTEVYGKWNLPAGKAEVGLTLEENAIKEAKEETGYDVEIIRSVGIYHGEGDRSVRFAYKAKITGGDISFDKSEILEVRWFSYAELQKMDKDGEIRNFWVMQAIEDSQKN
ncbi:MAG: NUDIX domain-containing protein [bacterium]